MELPKLVTPFTSYTETSSQISPQTNRRSTKTNMAGQTCKHQEDGPHTLVDLQDYRACKKPDIYTLKPCTDEEKADSLAVNFEKIHNSVEHNFSHRA